MNTQENILQEIKQAVLSVDATADVLLFGSRARGDFDEESDWDVLILTNEEVSDAVRLKYIEVLIPLQIRYITAINAIIKNKIKWRAQVNSDLFINIHQDGVVL
ncbi:nucleotidyltransferase domain-containing protein [Ilyomonas limi]|uniref:Nucleotidyltransferase domain-containing protein n=1 Tax=Ilyomonas limi TaxID=2575867 RepID=A0A4U3L8L4_9BACT|nr:nucleotidyltransferase domain-containing protein [Ilyomonas limi]TKK70794.1 nucleotidyltransferase domain-containing protein [Ilyomonas limi]